ncbi:Polysaccharide deacetylase [Nitrosospira sp. Nsp11]|uniref:polysaccharide deacetylase family protein n=1 Tax=Nitrosospira sp. Nsp11 TaxID=1855338 RepID=UPI000920C70C|nr:polysaccharide deacetylase family protein [Nitrosospira sp. Nsp11]SHL09960.1 Polysaccharide deacetylase [Nitrosospira sp. Nsp11]
MAATPIPLTLRGPKGSRLTNTELDTNFGNLSRAVQAVETATPPLFKRNYWKKLATVLDNMSAATTNWTLFSGTVTLANSASNVLTQLGHSNSLKIDVGTSFARIQRTIPATVLTGTVDIWVYISSDPPATASVNVMYSKDGFVTYMETPFTTAQYLRSGWNRLSVNVAEDGSTWSNGVAPAATGSTSFAAAMTGIRLNFGNFEQASPTTGLPVSLYLGGIFHGGQGQANVLLNWDDAYASQWDIFNIFRARELTGSLSVIPSAVGGGGLTLAQLRTIYDWGWDVVNHTLHGTAGNIASDSDSVVRTKIGGCRDWMLTNGFSRTANVLVWPENAYNDRVTAIAREYGITIARGNKNRITRTHSGIDNPARLGSTDLGGKTLAQAKKLLDAAELYSGTQIISGHSMSGSAASPAAGGTPPANGLDWYYNDYIALADDIAARVTAGTLSCINYSQLMANCRI